MQVLTTTTKEEEEEEEFQSQQGSEWRGVFCKFLDIWFFNKSAITMCIFYTLYDKCVGGDSQLGLV